MTAPLQNRFWPAPVSLQRHLSWVWRLTGRPTGPFPALPDVSSAHVIIHLGPPLAVHTEGGRHVLPTRAVVGAFEGLRQLEAGAFVDNVGLSLPPGCGCLVQQAAPALKDKVLPLAEVAPALDGALAQWAGGPLEFPALVSLLEAHLAPRCDALVHRAVAALDSGVAVSALAAQLHLSRRQLTRRFHAAVGLTCRDYLRRLRLARSWQVAATRSQATWGAIAAEAEYADQPHLAREYRELVGAPPSVVFPHGSPVRATPGGGT